MDKTEQTLFARLISMLPSQCMMNPITFRKKDIIITNEVDKVITKYLQEDLNHLRPSNTVISELKRIISQRILIQTA